jgi:hypothetical protein
MDLRNRWGVGEVTEFEKRSCRGRTEETRSLISEQARSGVSEGPSYEEIQKRGYEIHVERGGRHGSDLEDWLEAGRELKAKYQAG